MFSDLQPMKIEPYVFAWNSICTHAIFRLSGLFRFKEHCDIR